MIHMNTHSFKRTFWTFAAPASAVVVAGSLWFGQPNALHTLEETVPVDRLNPGVEVTSPLSTEAPVQFVGK